MKNALPKLSLVDAAQRGYFRCCRCGGLFLEPVENASSGSCECPACHYPNLKYYPPAFEPEPDLCKSAT